MIEYRQMFQLETISQRCCVSCFLHQCVAWKTMWIEMQILTCALRQEHSLLFKKNDIKMYGINKYTKRTTLNSYKHESRSMTTDRWCRMYCAHANSCNSLVQNNDVCSVPVSIICNVLDWQLNGSSVNVTFPYNFDYLAEHMHGIGTLERAYRYMLCALSTFCSLATQWFWQCSK